MKSLSKPKACEMTENLVLSLPTRLAGVVLSDFLDLYSLSRLDCAFCAHKDRDFFLSLLSSPEISFDLEIENMDKDVIESCIEWFVGRNVHVHDFSFFDDLDIVDAECFKVLFKNSSDTLEEFYCVDAGVSEAIIHATDHYRKILTLHGSIGCRSEDVRCILSKVCTTLHDWNYWGVMSSAADTGSCFSNVVCSNAKKVTIGADFAVREENIKGFETCFPNLEGFHLDNRFRGQCGKTALVTREFAPILAKLSHLHTISITENPCLTDSMVELIASGCSQLSSVNIAYNPAIGDPAVLALCKHCPLVTVLQIGGCSSALTDAAVQAVAYSYRRTLTTLSLRCGRGFTGTVIRSINLCNQLHSLDISGLRDSNEFDLCSLFTACALLRAISVELLRISNRVMQVIATKCSSLSSISLVRAHGYSEVGMLALLQQRAHTLRQLSVSPLDAVVNPFAIALLKNSFPRLHVDVVEGVPN